MSLAIYGAYRLLNPLQNVVRGFMPAQSRQSVVTPRPRALRVARIMDGQQPNASAGRMVISGRMADVCAELDRLVELENKR